MKTTLEQVPRTVERMSNISNSIHSKRQVDPHCVRSFWCCRKKLQDYDNDDLNLSDDEDIRTMIGKIVRRQISEL